jgi:hypothetical protein
MTGSRGAVLVYIGYISVLMISLYGIRDLGKIIGRLLFPAIIIVTIAFNIGNNPIRERTEKAYKNFMERFERGRASGEQNKRLQWDFTYFSKLERFPNIVFGIGTGATYQGANILFGRSSYTYALGYVEGELPKTVLEGGIIYLILKIILSILATMQLSFRHTMLRLLVWFTLVYGIPIVFNVHNAAFLLLGIILIDNIVYRQSTMEKEKLLPEINREITSPQPIQGYPQIKDAPVHTLIS